MESARVALTFSLDFLNPQEGEVVRLRRVLQFRQRCTGSPGPLGPQF